MALLESAVGAIRPSRSVRHHASNRSRRDEEATLSKNTSADKGGTGKDAQEDLAIAYDCCSTYSADALQGVAAGNAHMARRPQFLAPSRRNRLPRILRGEGQVLAPPNLPARVSYEVILEEHLGRVSYRGTLKGNHALLVPMWLTPVVVLRLRDAYRLKISITSLEGKKAVFEAAAPDV